jgi:hypothetical protein
VGKVYTYDYEVDTITEMRGTSEQQSKLKIKARAKIHAVTACDFAMEVVH